MPCRLSWLSGEDHDVHLNDQRRRNHPDGVPAVVITMLRARPSGLIEPCLPALADRPPSEPVWIHEISMTGSGCWPVETLPAFVS
jgi:hypothetical protein